MGGETSGRCGTTSGGSQRWRAPRILLLAVVADHLRALVRDMLGGGGQEVGGGEDLEVAVDLGIEPGAVDDPCHPGR